MSDFERFEAILKRANISHFARDSGDGYIVVVVEQELDDAVFYFSSDSVEMLNPTEM